MITKLRRILGLESNEERLSRLTEVSSSIDRLSIKIDDLADEFTSKNENFKQIFKSEEIDEDFKKSVKEKYDNFIEIQKQELQPLIKERRELKSQHQALMADKEMLKAVSDLSFYKEVKEKYKTGTIRPEHFDTILKAKTGVVKYADNIVFNEEGKFLILQRDHNDNNGGKWVVPGGHVDAGEEFYEAAKRELQEEAGITVEDCTEIGSYKKEGVEIFYFKSKVDSQATPIVIQSKEIIDSKWIAPSEIPNYEMPFNMAENLMNLLEVTEEETKIMKAVSLGNLSKQTFEQFLKSHKYIKKERNSNGGWNYLYKEIDKEGEEIKEKKYRRDTSIKEIEKIKKNIGNDFEIYSLMPALEQEFKESNKIFSNEKKEVFFEKIDVKKIKLENITFVQSHINKELLDQKTKNVSEDPIQVFKVKEKLYVYDGNHRAISAAIRGDNEINVRVYDLTEQVEKEDFKWNFKSQEDREKWDQISKNKDRIMKAIQVGSLSTEIGMELIEKARSGIYANTPENKKLGRVGQKYGSKKEVEKKDDSISKEEQQKNFINQLKSEGKAIFNSNRTKQTLDEIKSKHPDWQYIQQNKEKNGGYNYDYIKLQNGNGSYNLNTPSNYFDFIKDQGFNFKATEKKINVNKKTEILHKEVKEVKIENKAEDEVKPLGDSDSKIKFLQEVKFIETNETRVDADYAPNDSEYNQKKILIPIYLNKWDYAENTNPDIEEFSSIQDAVEDLYKKGDYNEVDKNYTPSKTLSIALKEAWVGTDNEIIEESDDLINYEDFYYENKDNSFVKKFGRDQDIDTVSYEERESSALILETDVYMDINKDIIKKHNGLNIESTQRSKYRDIVVSNKEGEEVGRIQLRIANHSYNPKNNDDNARQGNFISVEIANKNETKGRFNGKFGIQFDGENTYEEVVETLNERIVEIIDSWDITKSLEQFLLSGNISEEIIEKARTGKYTDTSENRRLKRVGQPYGSKKQETISPDKEPSKKDENGEKQATDKPIEEHAKTASESSLQAAAKGGDEELRIAAKKELERRETEHKPEEGKEQPSNEKEKGVTTIKDKVKDSVDKESEEGNYKDYSLSLSNIEDNEYKIVAKKDGKVTGELHFISSKFKPKLKAFKVTVNPDHRRQGLGSAMYEFAEKKLKMKFIKTDDVLTPDGKLLWNNPNRKFGVSEVKGKEEDSSKEDNKLDSLNETLKQEYKKVAQEAMGMEDFTDGDFEKLVSQQQSISTYIQIINNINKENNVKKMEEVLYKSFKFDGSLKDFMGDGDILGSEIKEEGSKISISTVTEDGFTKRTFDKSSKTVDMELFLLSPLTEKGKGKGTSIFKNQVEQFKKIGFHKLETHAGDIGGMNGYYTWARLGYEINNNEEKEMFKEMLKHEEDNEIKKATSLQNLMETKKGQTWWRENGFGFKGTFDLKDNSTSLKTLNDYKNGKN